MEIKTLGGGERLMLLSRMLAGVRWEELLFSRACAAERYGGDKSPFSCAGDGIRGEVEISEAIGVPRYRSLLVLPIPTSKDKKYITGTEFSFADAAELCDGATLAVGYNFPPELKALILERGGSVADAALDEPFLRENAVLTANATLGIILTDFRRSVGEMSVGIVGHGRIGETLVGELLFLGARVTVYTTRESVRLELCEAGVGAQLLSEESDFSGLDLLINTAPARVMSEEKLSRLAPGLRIMELASGENFFGSERVERLPALPERFYPETSAKVYKNYIIRRLCDATDEVVL